MENVVKLPIDLMQVPAFRHLVKAVGGVPTALYTWFAVWQGLAYRMQEGGQAGRVARHELPMLLKGLWKENGGELEIGVALPSDATTLQQAITEALFRADGDDLVCLRFIALNGGVSAAPRSMAQRGGDMRAFSLRQKEADAQAFQTTLNISEHKFVDEEGKPLDAELCKRVTRLIIACDNALFQPNRGPVFFTEGLIAEALKVARKYTNEEIDYICRVVAGKRSHPVLSGLRTEQLLPQFKDIVSRLEQK